MPIESIPLIYVAGPLKGDTSWDRRNNVLAAERLGAIIAGLGAMPVIPHKIGENLDGIGTEAFWYDATLALASVCHALVTVRDWRTSKGARTEVRMMSVWDRPIFHDVGESSVGCEALAHWITRFPQQHERK